MFSENRTLKPDNTNIISEFTNGSYMYRNASRTIDNTLEYISGNETIVYRDMFLVLYIYMYLLHQNDEHFYK